MGANGILVTVASFALPRTTTLSSVPALPCFFSTYPIAMFFFRVGLNAPLVISPTCSGHQCKLKIFQKLHLPEVGLGAYCSEVLAKALSGLTRQIHPHERYSPLCCCLMLIALSVPCLQSLCMPAMACCLFWASLRSSVCLGEGRCQMSLPFHHLQFGSRYVGVQVRPWKQSQLASWTHHLPFAS